MSAEPSHSEESEPPCPATALALLTNVFAVLSVPCPLLLAGKAPGEFPQSGLRLDYGRDLVSDPALDAVVAGLLQPMVDDRMTAREALGILEGKLAAGRCTLAPHLSAETCASSLLLMSCLRASQQVSTLGSVQMVRMICAQNQG